jgi:hypothetical protein
MRTGRLPAAAETRAPQRRSNVATDCTGALTGEGSTAMLGLWSFLVFLVLFHGWNLAVAVRCLLLRKALPAAVRWPSYISALLAFPAMVVAFLGMSQVHAGVLPWAWAWPLVYFMACWQVWVALRGRSRVALGCLLAYNALFGVAFLLRYVEYWGTDLGPVNAGLQVALTRTQMLTVFVLALWFPIGFYPPLLAWPHKEPRPSGSRWNLAPAMPAALLAFVLVAHLPHGYRYAGAWRGLDPPPVEMGARFEKGVVIRVSAEAFPSAQRQQQYLAWLDEAGLEAVNVFMAADIERDPSAREAMKAFHDRLRAHGVTVILTTDFPSEVMVGNHAGGVTALAERMKPWCRLAAREFRPEYLVPVIEPYGAASIALGLERPEPAEWHAALAAVCAAVEEVAPEVKTCVYFTPSEEDRELYRLCAETGTPDVLGFSFYSMGEFPDVIRGRIEDTRALVAEHGRDIEHWLFEFGHPPVTLGGEPAQANYVLMVLAAFADEPAFRGACVFTIDDTVEVLGLVNAAGHKREVFHALAGREGAHDAP